MAVCIPQLDNFMGLVGAFSGVFVALILPPILHILDHWEEQMPRKSLLLDLTILAFGILVGIAGTISSLYAILFRYVNTGGVAVEGTR